MNCKVNVKDLEKSDNQKIRQTSLFTFIRYVYLVVHISGNLEHGPTYKFSVILFTDLWS